MSDVLQIICGDAAEVLAGLEAESIDLSVTSPPYDRLRDYGGHEWDFEKIALESYRVLRAGGVLCWIVGDSTVDGSETLTSAKQKIFFREQCGFRIHDTMIYEKSNFGQPSHNRYHQLFEYVFVLSKGAPTRFNPIKDKPNVWAGAGTFGRNTLRESNGSMGERPRNLIAEYGMRGNVWRGNTRGQEQICEQHDHPAMMPKWLARDLIISWSTPGDLVLDCFAGSGTVAMEAIQLGRRTLAIEINPDYIPIIERSCAVTVGLPI